MERDTKYIMRWAACCASVIAASAVTTFNVLGDCGFRKNEQVIQEVVDAGKLNTFYTSTNAFRNVINYTKVDEVLVDYDIKAENSDLKEVQDTKKNYGIKFYIAADNQYMRLPAMSGSISQIKDGINVNVNSLMESYVRNYDYPSWDYKKRINDICMLWEFLVEQQGINENIAAAVIGSICFEGRVAMEQSSYKTFATLAEAEAKLSADKNDIGYGLVQWTYPSRRIKLLNNYRHVNSLGYDWESTCVLAECITIIEELNEYELFSSLYDYVDLEHALGMISCNYEKYSGCFEDWSLQNNVYYLQNGSGSGFNRLEYAENILTYFN